MNNHLVIHASSQNPFSNAREVEEDEREVIRPNDMRYDLNVWYNKFSEALRQRRATKSCCQRNYQIVPNLPIAFLGSQSNQGSLP